MERKITLSICGAGSRGKNSYGTELMRMRDRAEVVAVAEPDDERRNALADMHGIVKENRFSSAEEFFSREKMSDAVLVCTQDRQHVPHALLALERGYHVLLEKPVSPVLEELRALVEKAEETGLTVFVCHVLRYTPFFRTIKDTIDSGRIGRVVNIQAMENVKYWHQAHSFVRGNWRRDDETSPMILAKCCHDLDYLVWLSSSGCRRLSSFSSLSFFRKENAPEGASERCTMACKARATCPYDAEKIYLENKGTGFRAGNRGWPLDTLTEDVTEESIRERIENGPYGRCVFFCDNNVVDNQIVNMEMENGVNIQLLMSAFTSIGGRTVKILGTLGDIYGDMHENKVIVTPFGGESEIIDIAKLENDASGHAGGDGGLLRSFLNALEGKEDSSVTTLERSVESHLMALAAEESGKNCGRVVEIESLRVRSGESRNP